MRKFGPLTAILAAANLTACVENTPLGDPPPSEEVMRVAQLSHKNTYGRPAVGLRIVQIHRTNVFFEREDYLVCVTTQEKTEAPRYNNAGELVVPIGTTYRRSHALLMREYSDGWGAGVYRRVEAGKIGGVQMSDYCPPSERP